MVQLGHYALLLPSVVLINTAVTSVTHHSQIASYWPTRFNNTTTNITIITVNISSITIITIALISSIVCSFELKCQIIKPLLSYFPGNRGSEPVTPAVVVTNIIILTFIIIKTVILLLTMIILTKAGANWVGFSQLPKGKSFIQFYTTSPRSSCFVGLS